MSEQRKCENCGELVRLEAKGCERCGFNFETHNFDYQPPEEDQQPPPEEHNPKTGAILTVVGIVFSLVCLVASLFALTDRLANPAQPSALWVSILLLIGFQVGFVLIASGLALVSVRAVHVYLPLITFCFLAAGLLAGLLSYVMKTGLDDLSKIRPSDVKYGWQKEEEKGGLREYTIRYVSKPRFGPQRTPSSFTIHCPRRRTPPMTDEGLQVFVRKMHEASAARAPRGARHKRTVTGTLTIHGQTAYKYADEFESKDHKTFTISSIWWYCPHLQRLMSCVAYVEGGATSWELEQIEKMLQTIQCTQE